MVSQVGLQRPPNASLLPRLMIKIGSVIILFVLLLWQNVWSAYTQESPISNEAADILRGIYKNSPVVQFTLLRGHMPVLEVIMKNRHDQELSVSELLCEHSSQPGRLLITGQPGSGKTTLMRYLAKEWAIGRALRSCQILFLIYLGSLKQDVEINSLTSLLHASPYEDLDYFFVSKEIRKGHGVGACFLLDAYDEWKSDKKNFVHDIIFHNELHSSLVVCTSRSFNYEDSVDFDIIGFPFSHLTFLDFFATLHLTTLSRQEQLMHIMLYQDDYKFSMLWKFYFGLIGDVYYHKVSFISPFLKLAIFSTYLLCP